MKKWIQGIKNYFFHDNIRAEPENSSIISIVQQNEKKSTPLQEFKHQDNEANESVDVSDQPYNLIEDKKSVPAQTLLVQSTSCFKRWLHYGINSILLAGIAGFSYLLKQNVEDDNNFDRIWEIVFSSIALGFVNQLSLERLPEICQNYSNSTLAIFN